jgi:RHS repeat-associated protein
VDLQSVQNINSITVWGRTDCCWEMAQNFYVFVSDNPFSSTDLNTTLNQTGVTNYYYGPYANPGAIAVNRTGRYVRVQLAGSQYLVLGEVQVWGGSTGQVNWIVPDHLGTPRMIADQTGSLANMKRHDYLPFGEEIGLIGGRTGLKGFMNDGTRQKFTGYERDWETGLDYAKARYDASAQGRFLSVDPLLASADVTSPQNLNRYSYVENNPLNLTDPTGMMMNDASMGYGDVAGMWMGGESSSFGRFENGRSIIAARDADRSRLVHARIDGKLALHYLQSGNADAANRIFANNPNVGRFADGEARWGTDAIVQESFTVVAGPFVLSQAAKDAEKYNGKKAKTKKCATWVQQMAAREGIYLGPADNWYGGPQVITNDLEPGTVVISGLDVNGKYPNEVEYNHAGIFLYQIPGGFRILENVKGNLQTRNVVGPGGHFLGADQFFVLRVPVTGTAGIRGTRRQ